MLGEDGGMADTKDLKSFSRKGVGVQIPLLALLLLIGGCTVQIKPNPILIDLIQFQTALNNQYESGGMDIETFNIIQIWIGDGIRILTVNPKQWEGQARLKWHTIQSLCGPYDELNRIANKINNTHF